MEALLKLATQHKSIHQRLSCRIIKVLQLFLMFCRISVFTNNLTWFFCVLSGQILKGTLSCRKHPKDPRSLDVSLEIISSADGSIAAKQDYVME